MSRLDSVPAITGCIVTTSDTSDFEFGSNHPALRWPGDLKAGVKYFYHAYLRQDGVVAAYEYGFGEYSPANGGTLTRNPTESSNGDALVDWGSAAEKMLVIGTSQNFFGTLLSIKHNKPPGQPWFIGAMGDSMLQGITNLSDNMTQNTNVKSWETGGSGGASWKDADPAGTLAADYVQGDSYTGMQRGNYANPAYEFANVIQLATGALVFVLQETLSGATMVEFNPTTGASYQALKDAFDTATQDSVFTAAGGRPKFDFLIFSNGWNGQTTESATEFGESVVDAHYFWRLDGLVDDDTSVIMPALPDSANSSTELLGLGRVDAIIAACQFNDFYCYAQPLTEYRDLPHPSGNDLNLLGSGMAAAALEGTLQKVSPGCVRFVRSRSAVAEQKTLAAASEGAPVLADGNINFNAAISKLRIARVQGAGETVARWFRKNALIRLAQDGNAANYITLRVIGDGPVPSDRYPTAVNHYELDVEVFDSGSWDDTGVTLVDMSMRAMVGGFEFDSHYWDGQKGALEAWEQLVQPALAVTDPNIVAIGELDRVARLDNNGGLIVVDSTGTTTYHIARTLEKTGNIAAFDFFGLLSCLDNHSMNCKIEVVGHEVGVQASKFSTSMTVHVRRDGSTTSWESSSESERIDSTGHGIALATSALGSLVAISTVNVPGGETWHWRIDLNFVFLPEDSS